MTEKDWQQLDDAYAGLKHPATRNDRKRRLLDCACIWRILPFMAHPGFAAALPVLWKTLDRNEEFADGLISWDEMKSTARRSALRCLAQLRQKLRTHHTRYAVEAVVDATEREAKNKGMLLASAAMGYRGKEYHLGRLQESSDQVALLHDIFGNPFRPVAFDPAWRTPTAIALAASMYDARDFAPMPILADALEDAGCDIPDILDHARGNGPHVRGCWVVDLVLGKN